jgi:hypothetical protein
MVIEDSSVPDNDDNRRDELASNSSSSHQKGLRSIARLLIGGVLLGIDELNADLGNWREDLTSHRANHTNLTSPETRKTNTDSISTSEQTKNQNIARYALIGIALDLQERVQSGLKTVDQATRSISNAATPFIDPISNSRLARPFRQRYDELALRGQREVDRWVNAGITEDTRSRLYAQATLEKSVDKSIDYLTTNEEIKELIETQSVSLAGEVVEELRERAVSADLLLERIVRMILRLTPRDELPAPPAEIMEQARPFVRRAGRVVRKS